MARKKKVVLEPAGKDLKQFQAKYATVWKMIIDSPAYQAGTQFLRNRALERVAFLSEDDVEKHGREHLSELRGILRHENDMVSLHEMTDFKSPLEEVEDYISPEEEAARAQLREKFQDQANKQRYGH